MVHQKEDKRQDDVLLGRLTLLCILALPLILYNNLLLNSVIPSCYCFIYYWEAEYHVNVEIPKEDGTMETRPHRFSFKVPKSQAQNPYIYRRHRRQKPWWREQRRVAEGELASANLARWQDYAEEETPTQADLKKTDRLSLHALGQEGCPLTAGFCCDCLQW
jgi:hypothetical protein